MSSFVNRQHGEFALALFNNVSVSKAVGPWNLECVTNYCRSYAEIVLSQQLPRWAEITVLKGESLMGPEAEKRFKERIGKAALLGLSHVVVVTEYSTIAATSQRQFYALYADTAVNLSFANTLADGMSQLTAANYEVDQAAIAAFLTE